jgi:hypothetical protein
MNSKQRRSVKKSGYSTCSYNLVWNEFIKAYVAACSDFHSHEFFPIWLKDKPDYYIDIFLKGFQHKPSLKEMTLAELNRRVEAKLLGGEVV